MLNVKVHASTSNLGCGFDSVGMALDLYNLFSFKPSKQFVLMGFSAWHRQSTNMVLKSYQAVFKHLNLPIDTYPVSIKQVVSNIPVSRGLGSSSACIVAGIYAANYFLNFPLSNKDCLNLAYQLEGHPDNITSCIFGGLNASYVKKGDVIHTSFDVHPSLHFYVLIPEFRVSTKIARKALPNTLFYEDVVHTMSRAIQIENAYQKGHIEIIKDTFDDKLHEPYRYPLIENAQTLKTLLSSKHSGVAISGSGSTLFVVSTHDHLDQKVNLDHFPKWSMKKVFCSFEGVTLYENERQVDIK
jgi:homoserine kinase